MERVLMDEDLLCEILVKVSVKSDRMHCSEVSKLWYYVEGITHNSVVIRRRPERLLDIVLRFPNLGILKFYPYLQQLHLPGYREEEHFSVAELLAIANGCCYLKELDLSWRKKMDDIRVIALTATMTSLTDLSLEGTGVTDLGIVCLANGFLAKTLRLLNLSHCELITENGLVHLGEMTGLEVLELVSIGQISEVVTDITGVAISAISGLRVLDLSYNINVSDVTLSDLFQKCHDLEAIDLQFCEKVRCSGVAHKSLEILEVQATKFSVADAELLVSNFPSLKSVSLDVSLREHMSTSAKEKLTSLSSVRWYEDGDRVD